LQAIAEIAVADEIIIDGLEEHAFRRSIESMLRNGRADEAAERLKAMLPDLAGTILPARLLEITSDDLTVTGWDLIAAKLEEYGRGETPITAIGIGICDPLDSGATPDEDGNLRPPLETTYYSDATFPFSQTDREDLLEGYSSFGCEWQGDHDRADHTLTIKGIDDIYGAIAALEAKVAASERPLSQDIRAGAVGACYLGVLVFQAVRDAVIHHGLPRPLAILLVNSDAYPFFDAPVLTCDEYLDNGEVQVIDRISAAVSSGRATEAEAQEPEQLGSLIEMGTAGVKAGTRKKMALALEGDEAANPLGMADELVAEAAFNPTTFDYSRFMPQPVPLQNEAAPHWDEDFNAPEADYPVEPTLPESDGTVQDEIPADLQDNAEFAASEISPATQWPEPSAWQASAEPVQPDPIEPAPAAALPEAPVEAVVPAPEPAYETAQEPEYADEQPQPEVQPQPASHSLRSRMRIAPIEEEVPSAMDKLQASFAQFLKRVKGMLLRR
jgi:hypothetical protein